jgi:peptidoglycan/xylan/chitin deacetylase (PgdA/CDA1 family)
MPFPFFQVGVSFAAFNGFVGVASYGTFVPGSRMWGPVISHGSRSDPPRVALTFDDGPTAGATDRVLDVLGELNLKSAFFVIGRNVEREPDLLRRIDAEGHIVANHTFGHSRQCAAHRRSTWIDEIERTDAAIAQVIGRRPLIFRPPIGHKTPWTLSATRKTGHALVTWGVRGWDGIPTTAEKIVSHVVPRCHAGTIVILHDGIEPGRQRDPGPTIAAIKPMVAALRARGIEPVRLDELTGLNAYRAPV